METINYELISESSEVERVEFYKKTYLHVGYAILAFIGVESLLLKFVPEDIILGMLGSKLLWLGIIGAFWLMSTMATKFTFSLDRKTQYAGLGLYVLIEAIIFMPLLYIAIIYSGGNFELIGQAALITLFLFGGLTAYAMTSKKDFSFLRSFIVVGGFISLGLIVAGAIFGFNLGLWFSVGMVLIAAASIIYQTSKLKNEFATDQYVGAALQLFSSVMLLFWYILRILMSRKS